MFVVYQGLNEVLITTPENEKEFLIEYGVDRDFDEDYDRDVVDQTAVEITPNIRVSW